MVCPNCGKELSEQAKFCTGCGTTIAPAAAQAAPAPQKSGVKPLMIVLIAVGAFLALCLIIAVVVLCVLFGGNKQQEQPQVSLPEGDYDYVIIIDGNPVPEGNPYRDYYNEDVGFVLPDSHQRYYSRAELERFNLYSVKIALNEIYARQGYTFDDAYIQEYFDAMPWYTPMGGSPSLNVYEQANIILLDVMVREQEGMLYSASNPYLAYRDDPSSQILSYSAERYLDADDLETRDAHELAIIHGEILARHGVVFTEKELQEYFACKQWYVPSVEQDEFLADTLNDYENANASLVTTYMRIAAGDFKPSSDNKYLPYYHPNSELLLPQSSTEKLTYEDLVELTPEELVIVRNQIIARHGLAFGHQGLMEYFMQCSWYHPSVAPGRTDLIHMSSVEYQNMEFIHKYEQDHTSVLDTKLTYQYDTSYYSISLPAYWSELCIFGDSYADITCGEIHILRFYEGLSFYNSYSGGHLFSIMLIPDGESYDYPQYEYYGKLTDTNGNQYHVVVLLPSDVQFDETYKELYLFMSSHRSEIMSTIQFKNGYTYNP